MSISGDEASAVARFAIDGTRKAVRITGKAAARTAALIVSGLSRRNMPVSRRLSMMMRSPDGLVVKELSPKEKAVFVKEARREGLQYAVMREKGADSYILVAHEEDSSRIASILTSRRKAPEREAGSGSHASLMRRLEAVSRGAYARSGPDVEPEPDLEDGSGSNDGRKIQE
ncbi:MAG: DUF3801 domain-containing protein [Oscillospiraceae bacterium]